ncbi:hypothetical protein M0804_014319 [Polistes exclamans]|nr:hypothetical protein M0804_014319 [Polistes exclamans]
MIAGIIPLDHLAPRLAEVYVTLNDAEGPVPPVIKAALGAEARRMAVAAWREEELDLTGVTGETGVRVRAAIADRLGEWVERPHSISTTFHTTQLMTGHSCFPAFLCRIWKAVSPQCFNCGANVDDADHTLVDCSAWMSVRDGLVGDLGGVHFSLFGIVRASLDMPGGTHKRARPIAYTSSSEDEVMDLTNIDEITPEGPSISNLETGRLINRILDNMAEAEVKRKTCGNIKGEISGKMKSCHLEVIEMAKELQARNRANCCSKIHESLQQLRAEAKATNNRLKQLEEECTRLRRELKRKDILLGKVLKGKDNNAPNKITTTAAKQVKSSIEERLVAARKEDDLDYKSMGRVLNELSKSIIRIQQEMKEMKEGQGSYAQVAARPRVAPSPPMPTPLTTVPDGDGFEDVLGKDANIRADKLVQAMKGALLEAKIARPQRTSPIRLVGIYPTTTLTAIRCGLQEVRAGFDPNLISMGEVHLGRGSRYEGKDIILREAVGRRDKSGCANNVSGSAGEKMTVLSGSVEHSAGLSAGNEMEVEQGDSLVVSVYFPPSENLNSFSRLLDELEELLGTLPAHPVLVAGDSNARFPRWDPEGRSNPRGELLRTWANRLNLSLGNQVGHPTCVRPQGSSVVDLTWGSPAASVRLSDWRVDEAESLSDHLYIIFKYKHEATAFRSLRSRDKIFPRLDTRAVDEDRLAAALVSGEWTRDDGADLVEWVSNTLLTSCDMSMSRVKTAMDRSRVVPWWSREIAVLRRAATTARRRYLRARRGGDLVRIRECVEDRREKRRNFARAIRRAKASAWRDFIATIEDDPWGRPYKLVKGKLRARGIPLTEALDPPLLVRIVATLFPGGGRSIAPNVNVGDPDEIMVTVEEVRRAAKRIKLGRAPGPDGILGLVVKRAATHCGRGLAECFTMLLRRGVFLRVWKRARLVLIKKRGVCIAVKPSVKYLGIVLDSGMTFRPHFKALIPKAEGILRSIGRILYGPREKKRHLYRSVIHSVLLYGAPVCGGPGGQEGCSTLAEKGGDQGLRQGEEGRKCAIRSIEDLGTDTIPVRTHKRARPILYSSSSEDMVIDLTIIDEVLQEGPLVSNLETGRLIDKIIENIAEAEVIEMARELQARNRVNCGSDIQESLQQLRAEAKATNNRLKQLEEECVRLRREIKRKDEIIEKMSRGEVKNDPVKVAANQVCDPDSARIEGYKNRTRLIYLGCSPTEGCSPTTDDNTSDHCPGRGWVYRGKKERLLEGHCLRGMSGRMTNLVVFAWEGGGPSARPQQNKKKKKKKKKTRRIRETAAVSLTCAEGASYLEALKKLETGVNLGEIGAKGLSYRRGLTGSFTWQVRGKDANVRADRLAQAMKGALPEAKIARPKRTSPIKLVAIYPTTTLTAIRCGLQEVRAGFDPNLISMGKVHLGRGSRYEDLGTDTIPVRTHKRARPIQYSSSSEDEVIDLTNGDEVLQEGLSVSSLETGRLIEKIMENIAEAEVKRKTCGNIKGEVSGKMKSCHLEVMRVARELQARNRVDCGSDIQESLQQLRAEAKATNNRLKQLEEECLRLRREIKRKDAIIEKVSRREAKNVPVNQARSFAEERLVAARKEEESDNKTMGKVLTELSKSVIQIQQELRDIRKGQGSYAQVAARPRVAPSPPMTTPPTTVPDGDGFIEVRRKNRTATPAGGPQPTRDAKKDDPPGRLRVGGVGPSAGPQQNKKKKKKKKKTRRIRETAAVSLTCAEGASYLVALKKLETGVNLGEIGAKGLSYKRGLTGSYIWQVRGKDANVRADRLAQAMKRALLDAKIARPQRTSPIKLVGIYPTTSLTAIRCGLQEVKAGFDPNLITVKWGDSLVVSVYFPPSENLNSFSRLLDELEELLGTFSAIPALVAGDFNARFPRWDPEGRSNPTGELLCMWANRVNLSLANQVNDTLLISSDMSMQRVRMCANKSRAAPWWSREIALLRGAATTARRRYLRARRGGDPVRIRECLETRREKKRDLARAIRRAKASAWKNFIATIEGDSWGRPYRMVMGKLGARGAPLTEVLDPLVLERIVATLFPEGGRPVAPNVLVEEAEEIVVTTGEVRKAARRTNLGRAPGPDGIPCLVVKSAATYCGQGLAECFTVLLRNGVFPQAWKRADSC